MKLTPKQWKIVDDVFKALQEYRERGWADNLEEELWWDGKFATIKVGPLLLTGNSKCLAVHAICPMYAKVIAIKVNDIDARSITVELEQGVCLRLYPEEDGTWWDYLSSRLSGLDSALVRLREHHNEQSGRENTLRAINNEVLRVMNFSKVTAHEYPPILTPSTPYIEGATDLSPWTNREKR